MNEWYKPSTNSLDWEIWILSPNGHPDGILRKGDIIIEHFKKTDIYRLHSTSSKGINLTEEEALYLLSHPDETLMESLF